MKKLVAVLAGAALIAVGDHLAYANTIHVTNTIDEIGNTDDGCSLQDAIYAANFRASFAIAGYNSSNNVPNVVPTACEPGDGNDTIVLPTKATFLLTAVLDDATNFMGRTATPMITGDITIQANGSLLQRSPTPRLPTNEPYYRLFAVGPAGRLTLQDAYVKGFIAHGGNGGLGNGGGGMGAGGAIYVMGGALTILDSTFQSNGAIGGRAGLSRIVGTFGGGGGGVGGNGTPGIDPDGNVAPSFLAVQPGCGGGGGGARGDGGIECEAGIPIPTIQGAGGGGTLRGGDSGGFECGGAGGDNANGQDPLCLGGGGGGGGGLFLTVTGSASNGGNGTYGGGGGGGGGSPNLSGNGGNGGNGGFGGGGGGGQAPGLLGSTGGDGNFGGGAGGGWDGHATGGTAGNPGLFGGPGSSNNGGGGAGLGGAIFNDGGSVLVQNSTFTNNSAQGGQKGVDNDPDAGLGEGVGGAIFSRNGSLVIENVTIAKNTSSDDAPGVYVLQDATPSVTFVLRNTIISNNTSFAGATTPQCTLHASVDSGGDFRGNLIQNNDSSRPCDLPVGAGTVSTADPQLGPLQNNQGFTPTMAIGTSSPAYGTADPGSSLAADQRAFPRPSLDRHGFDIGAFELCTPRRPLVSLEPCVLPITQIDVGLTMQVSAAGAGTTSPPVGVTSVPQGSVQVVTATANQGYRFTDWSSNVTNPFETNTTVVMTSDQTVTASFTYCGCALDVSGAIGVTRGGFVLNLATGRYVQTVTLTNMSAGTINGPISLVLDGLSSYASLYTPSGTTDSLEPPAGSPYLNFTNNSLGPGASISAQLQFTDATRTTPINYATRVLAGPGLR